MGKEVKTMKAGRVLELLNISRPTLMRYRRKGYIRAKQLPTGQFNFNADDVFRLANSNQSHRLTIAYSRVSTYHQKEELANQKQELEEFCQSRGWQVDREFSEVGSGLTFNHRPQFFKMLDLIIDGKVERLVIAHKDRLSRVAFNMFEHLFRRFDCKIIVMNNDPDLSTDKDELYDEMESLMHCFAMRAYSSRQKLRKEAKDYENDHEKAGQD
jgi:putative resolvase